MRLNDIKITSSSTHAELARYLRTTCGTRTWDKQSAGHQCRRLEDGRLTAILDRAAAKAVYASGRGAVERVYNDTKAWDAAEARVCRYLRVKRLELFRE